MVSEESLQELKKILKEEYDVELEGEELHEFGDQLVDYFEVLLEIKGEQETSEGLDKIDKKIQNKESDR